MNNPEGIIRKYYNAGTHYFSNNELVPIDGVIRPVMRDTVIEPDENDEERVNKNIY